MGQVTGVWPTLTDSPERKELASSKNVGFVMFCATRPPSHAKVLREMGLNNLFLQDFITLLLLKGQGWVGTSAGVQGLMGGEERPSHMDRLQMSTSHQTRGS